MRMYILPSWRYAYTTTMKLHLYHDAARMYNHEDTIRLHYNHEATAIQSWSYIHNTWIMKIRLCYNHEATITLQLWPWSYTYIMKLHLLCRPTVQAWSYVGYTTTMKIHLCTMMKLRLYAIMKLHGVRNIFLWGWAGKSPLLPEKIVWAFLKICTRFRFSRLNSKGGGLQSPDLPGMTTLHVHDGTVVFCKGHLWVLLSFPSPETIKCGQHCLFSLVLRKRKAYSIQPCIQFQPDLVRLLIDSFYLHKIFIFSEDWW